MVYSNIKQALAKKKCKWDVLCERAVDIDGIAAKYLFIKTYSIYVNCFFCCR